MQDLKGPRQFSLLIKPISADCNLACSYCFYRSKSNLYPAGGGRHKISARTLERLIATYIATDQVYYSFNWQGGEPTLLDAGFYAKTVELQDRFGKPGSMVMNSLPAAACV